VNPDTGGDREDPRGPCDQSQGWKDGYSCLGADFLANLEARNNTGIPSMVVLSHDGDNAFGGGYSYYNECVPNLANGAKTRGNEVVTIQDYVNRYKNNITQTIHVEDGGWVNADGDFGSPTYINWNYPLLDASGRLDPRQRLAREAARDGDLHGHGQPRPDGAADQRARARLLEDSPSPTVPPMRWTARGITTSGRSIRGTCTTATCSTSR
jgi:hypothetical protein